MRLLAIGDIHGCLHALDLVLEMVSPRPDDLLVTLGDYIDRGPHSMGVLSRLIEWRERCRLVALKGNHDLMMVASCSNPDAFHEWFDSGGKQTLRSYGAEPHWDFFRDAIPEPHWRFLSQECLSYFETDDHFFVHANALPDLPLARQPEYVLYWEKINEVEARPHQSGKTMICGHSAQRSGKPLVLDHAICIDTWVYGAGWLTCLDVHTGRYWQANELGETRERSLAVDLRERTRGDSCDRP